MEQASSDANGRNSQQAKFITIYNQKGGSGKTTVACQLAGTLGLRGFDVLVCDLDPQESTSQWLSANTNGSFPARLWTGHRFGNNIVSEFEKFSRKYDIIVVDCKNGVDVPATWAALQMSDLALIPTKLGPTDLGALHAAKFLAKRVLESSTRKIPFRTVPVQAKARMADEAAALNGLINDHVAPLFMLPEEVVGKKVVTESRPLTLGDRKGFVRPMLIGGTAHSVKNSQEAISEIEALADFVLHTVDLPMNYERSNH